MDKMNYVILENLHRGTSFEVFRGLRISDNRPIIIKRIFSETPSYEDLYKLKNEFTILSSQNLNGAVNAIELLDERTLFLEDTGGISLKAYCNQNRISILNFFSIAIQICNCLNEIHKCNIIHKDIKPSNIIINPETNEIKLTDFGIATILTQEFISLNNRLEGTIEYISPEQTGRTGLALDYRTDLYSLGVTFYELLANRLPFESNDLNQIIHFHLAQTPNSILKYNSKIPTALSFIVSKLLAKSPEQRYQGAEGLRLDLEELFSYVENSGDNLSAIEELTNKNNFYPGKNDFSEKFSIPQKLYGRQKEIEILKETFEKNSSTDLFQISNAEESQNRIALQLVCGYSGIGKTSLIKELNQSILEKNGFFITGKFEQFQRNVPFFAIAQAFKELINQILVKEEIQLERWKDELQYALGSVGQVIIDVIPEVEILIGKQKEVSEIPPDQAVNRFYYVFGQFLKVFTKKEHPLVLFLDDLQWADQASLVLLKNLLTDSQITQFFVIGSYRDNEVDSSHLLNFFIHELEKNGNTIPLIRLGNLDKESIVSIVNDTLHCQKEESNELSDLILEKTNGNPFFTKQFLYSLYEEKLIYFSERRWKWDIDVIRKKGVSDNVVDLMVRKIEKFSSDSIRAISYAACIGNRFDLKTLSIILKKTETDCLKDLEPVLKMGLLLNFGDDYKKASTNKNKLNYKFKFLHDRVQQASYELVPIEKRNIIHFEIGKTILQNLKDNPTHESLFDIVDQLNYGLDLIETDEEKNQISQLFFKAGKQAKLSIAYNSSLDYLRKAYSLLSDNFWEVNYTFVYECICELGEVEYLCGNFENADKYFSLGLEKSKTRLDKVKIYNLRVVLYTGQGEFHKAVKEGLEGLSQYEILVPEKLNDLQVFKEYKKLKTLLGEDPIQKITQLPKLENPETLALLKLLININDSSYFIDRTLNGYLMILATSIAVQNGNDFLSFMTYIFFGAYLCSIGEFELGYGIGEFGIVNGLSQIKTKAIHLYYVFINHWRRHLQTGLLKLKDGFQAGIETGDLVFSNYIASDYLRYQYCSGNYLPELKKDSDKFLQYSIKTSNKDIKLCISMFKDFLEILQGKPIQDFEDNYYLPCKESKMQLLLFLYYQHTLEISFHKEDYTNAFLIIQNALPVIDTVQGMTYYTDFKFYYILTILSNYTDDLETQKLIEKELKQWKKWSETSKENYEHKFLLIQAEHRRVKGEVFAAMELYDQSIDLALENEFIQNAALASKLAGKFYKSINKNKISRVYFSDAYNGYSTWGAKLLAKEVEDKYLRTSSNLKTIGKFRKLDSISTTTNSQIIDINSFIKASQIISREVKLDSLLKNLLHIIMENAGAERVVLILVEKNNLAVYGEGADKITKIYSEKPIPLESSSNIAPLTIIRFVHRTRNFLVLDKANIEGNFTKDEYIQKNQTVSILCTPVINKGKTAAIIYMENNFNAGAFTKDRVETLQTLTSQMAISLENSLLYEEMEDKVKIRTKELTEALNVVQELKNQQDVDYYLTSLLINPLGGNLAVGEKFKIEFFTKQKKEFYLKNKKYEIGGDINISRSIQLRDKKYTVFLNGDAMGKSSQGAGGVIVLGTAFDVIIQRANEQKKQSVSPSKWLIDAFVELDKVFLGFEGLMLMSVVLGILDEESGELLFINAEQPNSVLYRDEKASYIEQDKIHNKLGISFVFGGLSEVMIHTIQLKEGDIFLAASDGCENIIIDGKINEDKDIFLKLVEDCKGDINLIASTIQMKAELTDDLSMLKVYWTGDNKK